MYFQLLDPLTADAPNETTTRKAYIFDVDHETLKYLPGVGGEVLAASDDLSRFLYADTSDDLNPMGGAGTLSVWADGHSTLVALRNDPNLRNQVAQGRAAADGSSFVFQNLVSLGAEFNHPDAVREVYRYDVAGALKLKLFELRSGRSDALPGLGDLAQRLHHRFAGVLDRTVARQPWDVS